MRIVYFIILFTFVCNYAKNQGLTNSLADMNNVLGAKNLLPNDAVAQTISGITLTKNSDGTVNVHGTNSSAGWINHIVCDTSELKKILGAYKGKKLILSTTKGYDYDTNNINLSYNIGGNIKYIVPTPKEIEFTVPNNIDSAEAVFLVIGVNAGATANTDNMGIMLRPASIQDDTYVPYSMTNREMTPYVQAISNPNLLDNPWFTVNQRGVSSFGGDTSRHYGPDRWQIAYNPSSNTINVTSDGLQIAPTTSPIILWQKWDEGDFKELIGKCITTSVMTSDGTIYSGSAIFPQKGSSDALSIRLADTDNTFNAYYQYNNNSGNVPVFGIDVKPGKSVTIKAVKLELGSVSTLAMDTVPNYQQELAKCQRYFQRINIGSGQGLGYGVATSTTTARIVIPLTVPIRDVPPTISISNADQILINGSSHTITKMEYHAYRAQNNFITVTVTTTGLTNEQVCVLRAGNTAEILEISTEL